MKKVALTLCLLESAYCFELVDLNQSFLQSPMDTRVQPRGVITIGAGETHIINKLETTDAIQSTDDFVSEGILQSYMNNNQAFFRGNLDLKGNSQTKLVFFGGSQMQSNIKLASQSQITITAQNPGTLVAGVIESALDNQAKVEIDVSNQAKANFDFSLLGETQVNLSLTSAGEFGGNFVFSERSKLLVSARDDAKLKSKIHLRNSTKSEFIFDKKVSHSQNGPTFEGSLFVEDSANNQLTFRDQAKGLFDLKAIESSVTTLTFENKSLYQGIVSTAETPNLTFNFSDSTAQMQINIADYPTFNLNANANSNIYAQVSFRKGSNPVQANFNIDSSKLYASISQSTPKSVVVNLLSGGEWMMGENSTIHTLSFGAKGIGPALYSGGENVVDMRFAPFNGAERQISSIGLNNRLILETDTISGDNGIFRIKGVFNQSGWGKDENGNIIATDKIITTHLQGNHHIQVFWNLDNFDASLKDANLAEKYIVVAEQRSLDQAGNFVGASAPVGVFEYETKLKKVTKADGTGYDWILDGGEDPLPPIDPPTEPPLPPEPPINPPEPPDPPVEPPVDPLPPDPDPLPPDPDPLPPDPPVDPLPPPVPPTEPPKPTPPPKPRPPLSLSAKALHSLLGLQYPIFISQDETLHKRMGDLRNLYQAVGVWTKANFGVIQTKETADAIASKQYHTTLALGGDYDFYLSGGKNFLGLAFNYTYFYHQASPYRDIKTPFDGTSDIFGVSIYDTFLFSNGFYIDAVLKYYFVKNALKFYFPELASNAPKFSNHNVLASIEIGKKFQLPISTPQNALDCFYFKPEAGLALGILSGLNLELDHLGEYTMLLNRTYAIPVRLSAELEFGKRFNSHTLQGDVFVGVGIQYVTDTQGQQLIASPYNQVGFSEDENLNVKLALGGNIFFAKKARLYFEVDTKFLGRIQPIFNLNLGVKVPLGPLVQRQKEWSPY